MYYLLNLIMGIITSLLSSIWIIHLILIYLVPLITEQSSNSYDFISKFLVLLERQNLSFLSIGIYSLICAYLLLTVIKGCSKIGLRFIFFFEIHPLIKNETYLNSIIFNVNIILISSFSIIQFCSQSFNEFASMTDINLMHRYQVRYLMFFKYFFDYNVFEIGYIVICLVSLIYLLIRPSDEKCLDSLVNMPKERELKEEFLLEK